MVPTLRHGDAVLVRRDGAVRPGAVVLARFPDLPDRMVVKRAVRPAGDGWWVEGDNPHVPGDSRQHGPAEVLGTVLLRYWPRPRRVS